MTERTYRVTSGHPPAPVLYAVSRMLRVGRTRNSNVLLYIHESDDNFVHGLVLFMLDYIPASREARQSYLQ